MIANFNLAQLFLLPVKDDEARKNFLIATLVYFVSFAVPILPLILGMGYTARIMRHIQNGGEPQMPAWNDWESMFKDGLYLFAIHMVYMLPIFVIVFPLSFGMSFLPIYIVSNQSSAEEFIGIYFAVFAIVMLVTFPISLALGILLPAAENHYVAHNDFAAAFRVREWWDIFRANWGGFLLAYLISMVASWILMTIVGIAMMTLILFCIVPFIMPAITAYLTLVMNAAFAQAYKQGKDRLAQLPIPTPQ